MTSFYKTDILINTNVFSKKNHYRNISSIKFTKIIQYINCNSFYFINKIKIKRYLLKINLVNNYILLMGAGSIFQIINKIIKKINVKNRLKPTSHLS